MYVEDTKAGSSDFGQSGTGNVTSQEETGYDIAGRVLSSCIPPLEIGFGTVGNALTVFMMTSRQICSPKTRLLLTCLAVTDTFVLFTGLLRHWLIAVAGYDFRDANNWSCAMHLFLVNYSIHLSSWLLVAVTLDRYISICFPVRARHSCTFSVVTAAVVSIFVALFLLNSHNLVGNRITEDNLCTSKAEFDRFYSLIWPWINLSLSSLFPFIILLTCNLKILQKFRGCKRFRQRVPSANDAEKTLVNKHLSAMLLTVNFVFLGTTLPIALFLLVDGFLWMQDSTPAMTHDVYNFIYSIFALISYVNNAANFYLYCFSTPVFRRELTKRIKRQRCARRVQPINNACTDTINDHSLRF
jgi:hypothetical protein